MELITYLVASAMFALLNFPGLRRYDGPKIPERILNDITFRSRSFFERQESMHRFGMRRMLSGSLFRAGWLLVGWGGTGILFFTGENRIQGIVPAVAFAFPWGFGLAVAIYNIRKWPARS